MTSTVSWKRVIRKVKMGKKVEKVLKERVEKGGGAASSSAEEEAARSAACTQEKTTPHTVEEYVCTGILETDFPELCALVGMKEIPAVTSRPRPPVTPTTEKSMLEERQSLSTPPPGSAPSGERFAYFRPRLQVELESEDPRTVREVQVKGWKVDERMVRVFSKSLPSLSSLQSFHLWNVGLTDSLLNSLQAALPLCLKLRMLVLDGTPIPQQSYYRLIAEDSALTHVSLRNNKIDAEGAKLIGQALSTPKSTNKNLTSLNLAYNHLSDQGADHIAQGLRLNRTLLCLSLAHNGIGDEGALKLAEVLGPFALTHEETVERRWLLLGRDSERQKSPATRRADSKGERPLSHHSSTSLERSKDKPSRATSKKKDTPKKDEKPGAANQGTGSEAAAGKGGASGKKEENKLGKKPSDTKVPRSKGARSGGKEKRPPVIELEGKGSVVQQKPVEQLETVSPLLDSAEHRDGKLFIPGNSTLASLNLMGNSLTARSLPSLLSSLLSQGDARSGKVGTGLLRLNLARNSFPLDCDSFTKIQETLSVRDPLTKNLASRSPEGEQVQPA
ncbi:leucine-rich repeat-containing protein 71-like isoform X2 [Acipenser ruthenus]|uniref:leucine-rich repeat-containing protein 71-like isoform X2 n=1 Tax=Acipenser ruthenus TaxID=7906 RepID=UPI0027416A90|nr:leucine-rich repeat-containing protein 71-like isoform X2 [Acipenser ruthenus]